MKLYTEEEIKRFIENNVIQDEFDLYLLTPIQLPSDEEIWDEGDKEDNNGKHYAFTRGAKWMLDKIQGGNNEQQ